MTPSETSGLLVYACPCPQNRYYTLLRKKSVRDGLLWFKQNMLFFPKRLLLTGSIAQWVFLKHQLRAALSITELHIWLSKLVLIIHSLHWQLCSSELLSTVEVPWKKHFLKSTQRTDRRCIWKQTLHFHCCPQWRWVSFQTNCGFCFLRTFKCFLNVWCFISLENLYHAQLKLAVCQVQRVKWSQIYYIHISLELSKYVHDQIPLRVHPIFVL